MSRSLSCVLFHLVLSALSLETWFRLKLRGFLFAILPERPLSVGPIPKHIAPFSTLLFFFLNSLFQNIGPKLYIFCFDHVYPEEITKWK
jgi:hypothetical protein